VWDELQNLNEFVYTLRWVVCEASFGMFRWGRSDSLIFIGEMGNKMLQESDLPQPAFDVDHEVR